MITGPHTLDYYHSCNLQNNTDCVITVLFLIAGLCVGLPALVWALWVIYKHRKNRGHISTFIILLLINDLIELLLTAIAVSWFLNYVYKYNILIAFVIFRINGMYLHQLVALESILSYKHKNLSDFFSSAQCSIILCTFLFLIVAGCQFVDIDNFILNLVLCILPFCILAVTCTLICAPPPNRDPAPPTGLKPGSAVLIVATLNFVVFSVQAVVVLIISQQIKTDFGKYRGIYILSAFLVNLRVISDPLLCVLVCKEKLRAQTQQTHSELNTEHQSV